MGREQGPLAGIGAQEGSIGSMQLQVWATQCLGRASLVQLGQLEGANQAVLFPHPCSYRIVYKAFINRDKECLVGELII
jgi:hypothetical protein